MSDSAENEARDRTALVTGASSGIGLEFCRRLAADGWQLVLVARRADRLEALAKELEQEHGTVAEVFPADLARSGELASVEGRLASEPTLELLVNNAGFGTVGRFAELDPDGEEAEIRLNVVALVRLARAALPGLLERGRGGIINVSSMAGLAPAPFTTTYAATKAFVTSFSEGLHEEVRGSGVTVQALCPGFTRTEFQEVAGVSEEIVPGFAWQEADAVVDAALSGLESGSAVVVPGVANQATAAASALVPRSLLRRVMGAVMARGLPED